MKRLYFPVLIAMGLCLQSHAAISSKEPEKERTVAPGVENVFFEYTIENTSGNPVQIESIKASCPCVQVLDAPFKLEAHQSSSFSVVMTPNPVGGDQRHQIIVREKDVTSPLLLTLTVHMPALAEVNPKWLFWQRGSEPTPQTFVLKIYQSTEIQVLDIFAMDENFRTEKQENADGTRTITVIPINTAITRPAMIMVMIGVKGRQEPLRIGIPCQISDDNPVQIQLRPSSEIGPDAARIESALKNLPPSKETISPAFEPKSSKSKP